MTIEGRTIGELLADARSRFTEAGLQDPATDARVLVAGLFGLSYTELAIRGRDEADPTKARALSEAIGRRLRHEPVHRILGEREFYGLPMSLSPATLEPRPDTEILVDRMLTHLRRLAGLHGAVELLDMGTGTGAICLALLHECPAAIGLASDISAEALQTAQANAQRNGLSSRFRTAQGPWFSPISGKFHAIVSNPPYIRSDIVPTLSPDVRLFDPAAALDGGNDGLDAYRAIAEGVGHHLHEDGVIGLEIGFDQRISVTGLFEAEGFQLLEATQDYGGNDRVLIFAKAD